MGGGLEGNVEGLRRKEAKEARYLRTRGDVLARWPVAARRPGAQPNSVGPRGVPRFTGDRPRGLLLDILNHSAVSDNKRNPQTHCTAANSAG